MNTSRHLPSIPSEESRRELYEWVDSISLSRHKRNLSRDFSDGVLVAEVVGHFLPHLVELHNYSSSNSVAQKMYNWNTLNLKVFRRLGLCLNRSDMEDCANCVSGAIDKLLFLLRKLILKYKEVGSKNGSHACTSRSDVHSVVVTPELCSTPASEPQKTGDAYTVEELLRILNEQDEKIKEMREKIQLLSEKNEKLEQLVAIKDKKLDMLLQAGGRKH